MISQTRMAEMQGWAKAVIPDYYAATTATTRELVRSIRELLDDRLQLLDELRNLNDRLRRMEGSAVSTSGPSAEFHEWAKGT